MVPAFGMEILAQNPSTENGKIPDWSCILSVVTTLGGNSGFCEYKCGERNPPSNMVFIYRGIYIKTQILDSQEYRQAARPFTIADWNRTPSTHGLVDFHFSSNIYI